MNSRGSITVEASIVVMITVFITFMIIFTGAYLQDYYTCLSYCQEMAWEGFGRDRLMQNESGEISWKDFGEKKLMDYISKDYSSLETALKTRLVKNCPKFWFENKCSFSVDISRSTIKVSFYGTYHYPFKMGFFSDSGLAFNGKCEVKIPDNREWMRAIKGIIKGFGG